MDNETLIARVAAYREHGSERNAATALGISKTALHKSLVKAAERGLVGTAPVMPGYAIKSVASKAADGSWIKQTKAPGAEFEVPAGHTVKGVSALVGSDGRVLQAWHKTGMDQPKAADIAETLKAAFDDWTPSAPPTIAPEHAPENMLNFVPCNDFHVGMFSWHMETDQNWDLKTGERELGGGIEDTIARSPFAGTTIVLGGGDLTHADNNNNQTSRSKNMLDVDGRHQKVMGAAGRLMVRTVDAALRNSAQVIVRNLKGNHDEETAPSIAWFLSAWYRNEPRVSVDLDQSLFFYHQHGLTMLAATHGHAAKLKDMPQIMAHRRAEMWGATKYRYAHGFHVHHQSKYATEGGGVFMETHQAPIPQDAWHFGAGFLSGRSLQSISYHANYGECGRVRVAMIDAANDNQRMEAAA